MTMVSCQQSQPIQPSDDSPGTGLRKNATCSLDASPRELAYGGGNTMLMWNTHNATQAIISPNVGIVELSGSAMVSITQSTTFVLMASSGTSTAFDSVSVLVDSLPPPFEFIYPLDVGNKWTYDFSHYYSYHPLLSSSESTSASVDGIITWTIISADTTQDTVTYNVIVEQVDSVHSGSIAYARYRSMTFPIIRSESTIVSYWQQSLAFYYSPIPRSPVSITRFPENPKDTLTIDYSVFANGIGMISYYFQLNSITVSFSEHLYLLSFSNGGCPFLS